MALLDPANLPTIITAAVGAIGMYGAHRTASRASRKNAKEAAEIEAYARARAMDVGTIDRQNEEISDLAKDNKELRTENRLLKHERLELQVAKNALVRRVDELNEQLRRKKNE